jgi:hypothetical protein
MVDVINDALRGGTNTTTTVQKRDVKDTILLLEPNAAPITVITAKLASMKCINPKFEWYEDELLPDSDAINFGSGYAAGATSMVVDNGTYFTVGDLIKVPRTAEVMQVTAVSTNTLTVTRSIGDTTDAAALVDDDPLFIIANALAQGSAKRNATSTKKTAVFNYCQIIKETIGFTNSFAEYGLYGGNDPKYQRRKKGIEFKKWIERAFIFGEKAADTSGTHPQYYTGGIIEKIATNITTDANGTLTEAELFAAFMRDGFRYGSGKKFFFCGRIYASAIDTWGRSKLQLIPKEKTFGIAATRLLSSFGEIVVIPHNELEGVTAAAAAAYGGYGLLLDMECLKYRYLQNRDMTLKMDVVKDGTDATYDEYIAEVGLEMCEEKRHSVYKGVTAYT